MDEKRLLDLLATVRMLDTQDVWFVAYAGRQMLERRKPAAPARTWARETKKPGTGPLLLGAEQARPS